jgi:hypothetical protein
LPFVGGALLGFEQVARIGQADAIAGGPAGGSPVSGVCPRFGSAASRMNIADIGAPGIVTVPLTHTIPSRTA